MSKKELLVKAESKLKVLQKQGESYKDRGSKLFALPQNLASFVKESNAKFFAPLGTLNLEEIWDKIKEEYRSFGDIARRYDSYLPLVLKKAVEDQAIYNFILKRIEDKDKENCLVREIYCYLFDYSDTKYVQDLRKDIYRKLTSSRKYILPTTKKYQEHSYIFSGNDAVRETAKHCLNGYFEYLESFQQSASFSLNGYNFFQEVLKDLFQISDLDSNYKLLSKIYDEKKLKEIYKNLLPTLLEQMIFSIDKAGNAADVNSYKEEVKNIVLKELGDPRVGKFFTNWQRVSLEAKKIMITWLSLYDLDMFFEIIRQNLTDPVALRQWAKREEFWKSYKNNIKEAWVAFGATPYNSNAMRALRAKTSVSCGQYQYMKNQKNQVAKVAHFNDSDTSCLLLIIGNYLFVERSHNGSLKIWHVNDASCPCKIGDSSIYGRDINQTKACIVDGDKDKIIHNGSKYPWQLKVMNFISIKCKITLKYLKW